MHGPTHIDDLDPVLGAVGENNKVLIICVLLDVQHVLAPDGLRNDAPKYGVGRDIDVNAKQPLMTKKRQIFKLYI